MCVGVKAGRQGQLPKGSLTLDRSSTGATLYMEPEPAVRLNNAEARLAGQEADEEDAILFHLSSMVADEADTLHQVSLYLWTHPCQSGRIRFNMVHTNILAIQFSRLFAEQLGLHVLMFDRSVFILCCFDLGFGLVRCKA